MRKLFIGCAVALAVLIPYNIHLFHRYTGTGVAVSTDNGHWNNICPLCHLAPIDGIVCVNTQTGKCDYVEVWQPHETLAGEAAAWEVQKNGASGYISFSFSEGGTSTTSAKMGSATYHFTWEDSDEEHYLCETHEAYRDDPYVIVDTKADPFEIYPVESGQKYKIRHNDVTVTSEEDQYTIDIVSHLYDREMEEWENGKD